MTDYYDRQGGPLTPEGWAHRIANDCYRTVAQTEVGQDVLVSTVWLGINYNWSDGPPIIFETMVFGGKHDQDQYRYTTEGMALSGHQAIVAELQKESQKEQEEHDPT